jgi:hypothetical protein
LVTTGGADHHRGTGGGDEVMEADQRRRRGLRVPARQDRADLAGGTEVGASDPLLVRVKRLADHLAELQQAG